VAVLDESGECIDGHSGYLGRATNNVAEYHGLVEALKLAVSLGAEEVFIQADSQLIVCQIEGVYRVKHPDLKPLYRAAMDLISEIRSFRIRHVPREENKQADRLVNVALNRAEATRRPPEAANP